MQPITWTLKDINEANAILSVLAKLPYDQVADLIHRLKNETEAQLQRQSDAPPAA